MSLALLAVSIRPLFWSFVVAFNIAGILDILLDYYLSGAFWPPDAVVPEGWQRDADSAA
jgi:hypothetical protein